MQLDAFPRRGLMRGETGEEGYKMCHIDSVLGIYQSGFFIIS